MIAISEISVRSSALRRRRVYSAITESGPTNSPWKHGPTRSNTRIYRSAIVLGALLRIISPTCLVGSHDLNGLCPPVWLEEDDRPGRRTSTKQVSGSQPHPMAERVHVLMEMRLPDVEADFDQLAPRVWELYAPDKFRM
jgi:hypothetical protein